MELEIEYLTLRNMLTVEQIRGQQIANEIQELELAQRRQQIHVYSHHSSYSQAETYSLAPYNRET